MVASKVARTVCATAETPIPEELTEETRKIGEFYRDASVLITGGTGFVGKALLEKLLRTCDGVNTIYLLVRPKRGLCVEQRLKELLKNPVFDKIKEKKPEYLDKIRIFSGDVALPNLGLNDADKQTIIDNVNITFHSAATVRFNENFKDAVVLNVLGTKRVIDLCKQIKNLKSFIHVSTAYSNADKRDVEEAVYEAPFDPNSIIQSIDTLPQEAIHVLTDRLMGKHPNTYTISKALAEQLIQQSSGTLPVAIVRPSIVTAAWKEPFPGWVDNVCGITGIMMEIGRGTIRSILCDEQLLVDLIPVDIVVNTLVTAAWHNVTNVTNTLRVYNCTSGQINGISWKDYGEITQKYAREFPSKYISWYPGFSYRTNRMFHWFYTTFFHMAPAFMLDIFLYCTKHKPIMLRICKKFTRAAKQGEFFALNEWNFRNDTLKTLMAEVASAEDGEDYCVDFRPEKGFEWDPYVKNYMLGIRQYVLKDDLSSLTNARTKLNRLYWIYKISQLVSVYALFRLAFR